MAKELGFEYSRETYIRGDGSIVLMVEILPEFLLIVMMEMNSLKVDFFDCDQYITTIDDLVQSLIDIIDQDPNDQWCEIRIKLIISLMKLERKKYNRRYQTQVQVTTSWTIDQNLKLAKPRNSTTTLLSIWLLLHLTINNYKHSRRQTFLF